MLETIKGNFFSYLFSQPEYMLQLYQVMHPEDTETRTNPLYSAGRLFG